MTVGVRPDLNSSRRDVHRRASRQAPRLHPQRLVGEDLDMEAGSILNPRAYAIACIDLLRPWRREGSDRDSMADMLANPRTFSTNNSTSPRWSGKDDGPGGDETGAVAWFGTHDPGGEAGLLLSCLFTAASRPPNAGAARDQSGGSPSRNQCNRL